MARSPYSRVLVAALALLAPVALATPAAAAPAAAGPAAVGPAAVGPAAVVAAAQQVRSYVALGDSYTAGPLIPVQTGRPPGCLRSSRNYPSLVAQTLGVSDFRDASCSGATTDHLTRAQRTRLGVNPAQLDSLDAEVDLVSLGIGGNDVGFGEILHECASRSPRAPFGSACKDYYTSGGEDRLAARIAATAPDIAAALAGIGRRAPDAKVLLVGYPAILPDKGPGCFPVVPFSAGDVAYLRATEKRLNAMLAAVAGEAHADYVDTYTPTIGHDACQPPGRKWIEGFLTTSPAAPMHPNALGMTAMAVAVGEVLAERGIEPAA